MPLSEHEERILAEIERQLADEDPRFVARTRSRRRWSPAFRIRLAAVLAFLGVVGVLSLTFSVVAAAAGMTLLLAAVVLAVTVITGSDEQSPTRVPPDERH